MADDKLAMVCPSTADGHAVFAALIRAVGGSIVVPNDYFVDIGDYEITRVDDFAADAVVFSVRRTPAGTWTSYTDSDCTHLGDLEGAPSPGGWRNRGPGRDHEHWAPAEPDTGRTAGPRIDPRTLCAGCAGGHTYGDDCTWLPPVQAGPFPPEIGSIVRYTLTEDDANAINRRRDNFHAFTATLGTVTPEPGQPGNNGHMANVGNPVRSGDVFPAIVTRVFNPNGDPAPPVSMQVVLDGNDTHWVSDVPEGDGAGTWSRTRPVQQGELLPLSDQDQLAEVALPRIRSLALPDGRFAFVVSGYQLPDDPDEAQEFGRAITEFADQCGAVATGVFADHIEVN